jgi:drug/metabolite transporter (DMT)-like permease
LAEHRRDERTGIPLVAVTPARNILSATRTSALVRSRAVVHLGLLYVVTAWGLNTVLVKEAVGIVPPLLFTTLRFLVMVPLAFALVRLRGESLRVHRADLPRLVLCGIFGFGLYQYLWVFGLAHTTAFASALLGSTTPVLTLAILAVTGRERVAAGRWVGAGIALLGVAIFEGAFSGRFAVRSGDVLTLAGALSFALYNVLSADLLDRYPPFPLLAITMALGTILILPGGAATFFFTHPQPWPLPVWAIFGYAVLFPILLTYPVWSMGITRLGAGRASLYGFLVPVVAGVAALPILHAHLAPYQIAGAAITLGGMAIAHLLGRVSLAELWTQRTLPAER